MCFAPNIKRITGPNIGALAIPTMKSPGTEVQSASPEPERRLRARCSASGPRPGSRGPLSLQDSVRLATVNPAGRLGIAEKRGVLAKGHIADVVVLAPAGEVVKTMVAGVFQN